jgi:hypothetical protein
VLGALFRGCERLTDDKIEERHKVLHRSPRRAKANLEHSLFKKA